MTDSLHVDLGAISTSVLACMTEGVSLSTDAGIIVYTNPAEDRMFGYERGELLGKHVTCQNAGPAADNARRVEQVLEHLRACGTWEGDWHNLRKDGTDFYTSARISAMQVGGERFWLCVQRDVTERRRAELAREVDRQQLRAIIDNLVQSVLVFDRSGVAIDANRAAADLHGFQNAQEMLIGLNDYAGLFEARDSQGRLLAVTEWPASRALAGEAVRDCELHVTRVDTGAAWVGSYNAAPVRNERGEVVRAIVSMHDITDRQRHAAALRDSEERFRLLVHAMPQLAWVCRNDGYAEFSNERWLEYTGQTLGETYGRGWMSVLHPDDVRRIAPLWEECIVTGAVFETNYRIRRASDGMYRWHLTRAVPLRDSAGNVVRWLGTNTDIEDQLQADAAHRETADRLSLAMAASRMGDWSWDATTDIVTFSDMAAAVCGVPPGPSMTWTAMRELLFPGDRDRARSAVEQAVIHHSDYDIEYRILVNGAWRWLAARGRAVYDQAGRVTGMRGILQDVTDRRNAEQELAEARDHANSILESITDAFFALDHEWRFTYVNREAERVLARPRGELLGRSIWDEFAPAVDTEFWHAYHRARNEQVSVQFEALYEPLQTWFDVRAYPTQTGLAVYFQNVNERRRLESEREAALERLERSNEDLRRANTDLEQFAFAAAHDLQEPLRMVATYTQLLGRKLDSALDTQSRQFMDFVIGGARRMSLLLTDLLSYTETARGNDQPPADVDLNEVVAQALANLAEPIEQARASIAVQHLPGVLGRQGHFVQLFQNLIGNAIKYRRPEAPPLIEIDAESRGPQWLITVADNGLGIDPAWHSHIFGVFRRLHGREIPGTGIGLAICQRVVERAGGTIWVESEPGKGSKFRFTLPR